MKDGNRERIISWLFKERYRQKHINNQDNIEISEPQQENKDYSNDEEIVKVEEKDLTLLSEDGKIEQQENKSQENTESTPIEENPYTTPPITFVDEIIKEQNEDNLTEKEENATIVPEVEETVVEDKKNDLIQVSVIEEIDTLLLNDKYDLQDIKYELESLMEQEKDEVLLENVEKIQKQLEELIKEFEEIKKKYDKCYSNISINDINIINDLDMDISIQEYIDDVKNGNINDSINNINEMKEFINIINNIIEIERQKDIVKENINNKLENYSIRDDEFIELQDRYADVENINTTVEKYNVEIGQIIDGINSKLKNSVNIEKTFEQTSKMIPDVNKMLKASIMFTSAKMIPPTPAGQLFRASILISATEMMASAFIPKTENREIKKVVVTDYSRDILNSKDNVKEVLDNIEIAFDEINNMKDIFDKELYQYRNDIPEYSDLIKNIFAIEKELSRQQAIAYDYDNRIDNAYDENNQKIKILENE